MEDSFSMKPFYWVGLLMPLFLGLALVSARAGDVADALSGKLVERRGSELVPAAADVLSGKTVIALYYSSYGPHCQDFAPQLVDFYREAIRKYPHFQLVMFCRHAPGYTSDEAMEKYIVAAGMDWPVLTFPNSADVPLVRQFATGGVPNLVVLDADGNVMAGTIPGEDRQSAPLTLGDLKELLDSLASESAVDMTAPAGNSVRLAR